VADPGKRAPQDEPVPDEPPYGELGWAAEQAYLRLLATSPLADGRPCGDGVAVITGVESNTENGVVCSRLDDGADADATLRWFAERDAPAQWLLAEPVAPADLRGRLVAAGASAEPTAVVMGAVLDRLALDDPLPRPRRARARAGVRARGDGGGARVALVGPTPDTVAFYRLLGFSLRPWPRDRSFHLPEPR
jgi:hypothetical protein